MLDYIKLIYYLLHPNTLFVKKRSGAVGDDLLMSCVLPGLKNKYPSKKIIIEANWVDLFKSNPHVHWITDKHLKTTKKHLKPKYIIDIDTTVPIIKQLGESVGLSNSENPFIYLEEEEIRKIAKKYDFPYIVIAPVGKQKFSRNRKDWGIKNFQSLRDMFAGFNFIQTGAPSDPLMENVIDERGLDIRSTAALLKNALFFLGLEGGLMHLSKAVRTRSVIIYGGAIKPEITGYEDNLNISTSPECSPCFHSFKKNEVCPTMICMNMISPEYVANQINEHLKEELKSNEN